MLKPGDTAFFIGPLALAEQKLPEVVVLMSLEPLVAYQFVQIFLGASHLHCYDEGRFSMHKPCSLTLLISYLGLNYVVFA